MPSIISVICLIDKLLCSIASDEWMVFIRFFLRSCGEGILSPRRVIMLPTCSDISPIRRIISDVILYGGVYIFPIGLRMIYSNCLFKNLSKNRRIGNDSNGTAFTQIQSIQSIPTSHHSRSLPSSYGRSESGSGRCRECGVCGGSGA